MNGMYLFLLARFIHVVCGVVWAGSLLFIAFMLMPAIRATGPSGGAVMQQLFRNQRLQPFLITLMVFTVLSGLALYRLDMVAFGPNWVHTGPGRTFSAGAVFAILAVVVGLSINARAAEKIGARSASIQAAGKQPSTEQAAELGRLQTHLARGTLVSTALIIFAVTCMGVARYVP
ncbi:MAG: hypothetical protein M3Y30_11820 [Gemmatimonadota bacterium]|nr:hypothetical protein [Gemmatimonadota bacterium]